MNLFEERGGELFCEDVPLARIAARVGTPVYVYSAGTLRRHARVFREAARVASSGKPVLCCYAVKAAGNLSLLSLLRREGFGFDIVSGGELHRALAAGAPADTIVFSGVGKREDELRAALGSGPAGILQFNCESEEELARLSRVAKSMRKVAPVAIRVNPDVDAKTHPYIATALQTSKFGIPASRAKAAYRLLASLPNLKAIGLACHIGSQITELRPFVEAATKMRALFLGLRAEGHALVHLDLGGGLGVPYSEGDAPVSPASYGAALSKVLAGLDVRFLFEPGRLIVANAGLLLSQVILTKRGQGQRRFAVIDAGMNDLMRPALYQAKHEIEPVRPASGSKQRIDIVGPVCESADVFAKQRMMPKLSAGDLVAIRSAGAYGMSMASNYNDRMRPAEVLVDGSRFKIIRKRETLEDLVRGE